MSNLQNLLHRKRTLGGRCFFSSCNLSFYRVLCILPLHKNKKYTLPASKSQLISTSVVKEIHFGAFYCTCWCVMSIPFHIGLPEVLLGAHMETPSNEVAKEQVKQQPVPQPKPGNRSLLLTLKKSGHYPKEWSHGPIFKGSWRLQVPLENWDTAHRTFCWGAITPILMGSLRVQAARRFFRGTLRKWWWRGPFWFPYVQKGVPSKRDTPKPGDLLSSDCVARTKRWVFLKIRTPPGRWFPFGFPQL